MDSTIHTLITCHQDTDFLYIYRYNGREFQLDTREIRMILGDVPFDSPDVSAFIMQYLQANRIETDGGAAY